MATYEEHIEGLTNVPIGNASATDYISLTEFNIILRNAVKDCVQKIISVKPSEAIRFSTTSNGTGSIVKTGQLIAVLREHDSQTIKRPCSQISPLLRYEATNIDSLHYRSKYNPAFYEIDNIIYVVPTPNDATDNDMIVTQIDYDSGLASTDDFGEGNVEKFPFEYEYLLGLYSSSMVCIVAANHIQNNMPTIPTAPLSPNFTNEAATLPTVPIFVPPELKVSFASISSAISREDFDLADKQISLFDKEVEVYGKDFEKENSIFTQELEVFKSDLDKEIKDSDRKVQVEGAEYKAELERYQAELESHKSELQEKMAKYKWYTEQSISFLNQYHQSITGQSAKQKKKEGRPEQRPRGESK